MMNETQSLHKGKANGTAGKIAIASDHAGFETKKEVVKFLEQSGYKHADFGTDSSEFVDYPDFAFKAAESVSSGECQRGILICGTGLGMCIAANKVRGIRAVACYDEFTAEMSRRHNDANILCLGARAIKRNKLMSIVKIWLETQFESEGGNSRHRKRLQKIADYEIRKEDNL